MKDRILKFISVTVILSCLIISSCKKDQFTKEDAIKLETKSKGDIARLNDSLRMARLHDSLKLVGMGGVIQYSINIVAANQASFGKKDGLDSTTVTISQYGVTSSVKSGTSGIVLFSNACIGEAAVVVSRPGYTTVN